MSSELPLPSLLIRGYRGFRELRIERLGRANLIVGKNNVGKTSVLEALRLFAKPGSLDVLFDILEARDEFTERLRDRTPVPLPVAQLLNHRGAPHVSIQRPFIGPVDRPLESLMFWPTVQDLAMERLAVVSNQVRGGPASEMPTIKRQVIEYWVGTHSVRYPIDNAMELLSFRHLPGSIDDPLKPYWKPCAFIGPHGLSQSRMGELWNQIVLTSAEDDVLDAMRIITPDIFRIVLKHIDDSAHPHVPYVRVSGEQTPVTLRSLGDGVNRLFGLAISMASAEGGFLLVDEIENGVHYSVQTNLWRFLFKVARRLNLQVFATSHSGDMVKAFQIAASENKEEEGVLVRLAQKAGRIVVAEFDENDLEIAVEGQIEVR